MALLIVIGLAVLRCLDAHRVDEFAVNLGSTHLTFLSAIDQLAFSIDRDPNGTSTNPPPWWIHDSMSDRDCPERDDMSTYLIAIYYHPWFTPMTGWQRPRGWKRFDIIAPWGPARSRCTARPRRDFPDVVADRVVVADDFLARRLHGQSVSPPIWPPTIERRFAIMPFAST